MEKETYLIVGLGNPGSEYAHTRHNAGFEVTDRLARELGVSLTKKSCDGRLAEISLPDRRLVLCQPLTYMNLSGECTEKLVHWYKPSSLDHLLVIYDDIDLPMGRLRMRKSGSAGTHNGMRNILQYLPAGFPRLRVGVGGKPEGWDLKDWVLSRYSPDQQKLMDEAFDRAAQGALTWLREGPEKAMQLVNQNPRSEENA